MIVCPLQIGWLRIEMANGPLNFLWCLISQCDFLLMNQGEIIEESIMNCLHNTTNYCRQGIIDSDEAKRLVAEATQTMEETKKRLNIQKQHQLEDLQKKFNDRKKKRIQEQVFIF